MSLPFTPLYYSDKLEIVNLEGDVGLVTLWTPLRTAKRILSARTPQLLDSDSRIAVYANLYGDGMYHMLCNLLYNPQIRYLVAVGEDLGLPTVSELRTFLENGAEPAVMLGRSVLRVPGTGRVFPMVENFDVERLRRLEFTHLGRLSEPGVAESLADHLANLPRATDPASSDRIRVEIPPALASDYAYRPSEVSSHQISRARPLDCWEELVTRTMRFGHPARLRTGPRLELLNARVIIREPAEDPEEALNAYGFSLDQFHKYQNFMFQTAKPADIDYTYGNRLGGYFKNDGKVVDAIAVAGKLLAANPESRHAYISLWDTSADLALGASATPCLVTIFFRRIDEQLTMTATYRSHNLLSAWMQNVYGLMAIQREVAAQSDIPSGPITVISHSLGIDPRSSRFDLAKGIASKWDRDDDLDRDSGRHSLREDPSGYFVVTIDDQAGEIVAEHRFNNMLIKQYRGSRAKVEREIIGDMAVSLVSHALWLGRELSTKDQQLQRLAPGRRRARGEDE